MGSFLLPVAHLLLDHSRVDPIAPFFDDLMTDLFEKPPMPVPSSSLTPWRLREPATENLQRIGEREPLGIDRLLGSRLEHQDPNDVVADEQSIELLHHSSGRLAAEHRPLALVGLQLIDGQLFFPAFMVELDEPRSWMGVGIQQSGQQPMLLAATGSIGVIEGVLDDPHQDSLPVMTTMGGAGVEFGQGGAVREVLNRLEDQVGPTPISWTRKQADS